MKTCDIFYLESVSIISFSHFFTGMQAQYKQRRKYRDPETCCTPPLVEDNLWTTMDDDPFGVYTSLGMYLVSLLDNAPN